jgi:hypothetical protein
MADLYDEALVRTVAEAVTRISPLLAGKPGPIQGMILAQLTAIWIGNHRVIAGLGRDQAAEQRKLWDELVQMHMRSVRELVEIED